MQKKRVIALGFFDGVHIGHGALLNRARELAAAVGAEPAVISFDRHPDTLVRGVEVPLINSAAGRRDIVQRLYGIDSIILIHFDRQTMNTPWRDFIDSVVSAFDAVHLVVGHDFRCGFRGEGSAEIIRRYCAEIGVGCDIIEPVRLSGITVSSTLIRSLLTDGEIGRANEFLGHPHILLDYVRFGYRLGRQLGAPTINMRFNEGVLVPRLGVYATKVVLSDGEYPAVTNIGVRPTFGGEPMPTVESHILELDRFLYGEQVRVEFHKFLRPEQRFDSAAGLAEAISRDKQAAIEFFR